MLFFRNDVFRPIVLATATLVLAGCCLIPHNEVSAPRSMSQAAADDRTMGDPNAPVVFVEYASPICPHCAHFASNGLPNLKEEYIDKGKVYFIFRVFPLSAVDGAVEAIGRCLPREQYFSFMDMMFRNQSEWDPDGYEIPDVHAALIKMAGRAGMSQDKAEACIGNRQEMDRINAAAQDAVDKYTVNAVPTFVINGKVIQGYSGWPQMKAEIEALLPKQ